MAGPTRGVNALSLAEHGAEHFPRLAEGTLADLAALFARIPRSAGYRLKGLASIGPVIESTLAEVERLIGPDARPVRAVAFDKTPNSNWSLGWHQDRTICVKQHHAKEGFRNWTTKQGAQHVEPPFALIGEMLTARIHLDAVNRQNAPLKVALGTHKKGYIPSDLAENIASSSTQHVCLAEPGDVWLYATAILHASERSGSKGRRRVLQLDFCSSDLPEPLQWADY